MRPQPRSTRNITTPPSPHAGDRPRPTIADMPIAPRRRLRDGSTSSRGRSSRGTSVGSSSSRGSSTRRALPVVVAVTTSSARHRRAPVHVESSPSSSSSNDIVAISDDGINSTRESTLSPLPALSTRRRIPPSSILDDLDNLAGIEPHSTLSTPPHATAHRAAFPLSAEDFGRSAPSTASSSSSSSPVEITSSAERRYTTQEKGKGRAVIPSPIEVESSGDADDSVQLVSVVPKRKRSPSSDQVETVVDGEVDLDEESSLGGGYSCPICFCPPSQAVMTQCGHIMCAQCLHSSLTAAIGRNPNSNPNQQPPTRGRGGAAGRGRGRRGAHRVAATTLLEPFGPKEWSKELLQEAWTRRQVEKVEQQFRDEHVPEDNWEVMKEGMIPEPESVKVQEVLKGLWRIEDVNWVVEGECPVCRNVLPGGYGPPYSGIGGIIPLEVKVSTPGRKRRRVDDQR